MGKKTENLKELLQQGWNVHSFEELKSEQELRMYLKKYPICSIRFDRNTEIEQLPFYVFDGEIKEETIQKILEEASLLHCTLLASNGHQYDPIQICNFVGILLEEDSFLLEISTKPVPLRNMYEWDTTTIRGSFLEPPRTYQKEKAEQNPITNDQLEQILTYLMRLNLKHFYIEGTLYQKKVGIKQEPIVIWQTRKEG